MSTTTNRGVFLDAADAETVRRFVVAAIADAAGAMFSTVDQDADLELNLTGARHLAALLRARELLYPATNSTRIRYPLRQDELAAIREAEERIAGYVDPLDRVSPFQQDTREALALGASAMAVLATRGHRNPE
ncbi:MAG TPA: hypothetical protein PKE32_05430 [Miltoncostaeaceae bacterium]|nr:hypothetical protein [Miltoncostaeaceae bacterium]